METYLVKRLDQAKLLTDPFKLKLIEQFARKPATTKQVADRLGVKAPRLYRHVDALAEQGLLILVEERPKRGTVERYYRTVADRFEVDQRLFSSPAGENEAANMIRSVLRDTETDLVKLFEGHGQSDAPEENPPMVMKVAVRGTAGEIARLRARLEAWLEECNDLPCEGEDTPDLVSYSALLAFYPRAGNDDRDAS